jgi:hypothetical protein
MVWSAWSGLFDMILPSSKILPRQYFMNVCSVVLVDEYRHIAQGHIADSLLCAIFGPIFQGQRLKKG